MMTLDAHARMRDVTRFSHVLTAGPIILYQLSL